MQPEARLGHSIKAALEAKGAFVFKVHGSGMMMAGLPDLIVCYKGNYIGLEIKTPTGVVSKIQEHTHKKIRAAGGGAFVVRSVQEALDTLLTVDVLFADP